MNLHAQSCQRHSDTQLLQIVVTWVGTCAIHGHPEGRERICPAPWYAFMQNTTQEKDCSSKRKQYVLQCFSRIHAVTDRMI